MNRSGITRRDFLWAGSIGVTALAFPNIASADSKTLVNSGDIGQSYECSCGDVPNNKHFDPVIRHNNTFVKTTGYCTDIFFHTGAAMD